MRTTFGMTLLAAWACGSAAVWSAGEAPAPPVRHVIEIVPQNIIPKLKPTPPQ